MGQGLRLWDQYGNIILDTDSRLARNLDTLYLTNRNDGERYVPEFSQGQPWFYTMIDWANVFEQKDTSKFSDHSFAMPELVGNTLKWHWGPRKDGKGYYHPTWIVYGVY
ncbi:MAG: hypothetical protein [Bacteriophage sp.]|uniref:hypothetical protein n=1 Tax=uncultured Bartonella sp. TaxID=104108 RepID=UPI001436DD44|nr:hypothetical protein [uncultured Bartonella sp.]QHJ78426.1 MAG: hypothetical protein [Bacteriophage sp.]